MARQYNIASLACALALLFPMQGLAQPVPIEGNQRAIKKDLQIDLEKSLREAERVLADLDGRGLAPAGITNLISLFDQIRADALLIKEDLKLAEQRLRNEAVSVSILDRQARMSAAFGEQMDRIEREMDAVVQSAAPADGIVDRGRLRAAVDVLIRDLTQQITAPDRTPLGVSLPYRSLNLPQVSPQLGPAIVPAYLDDHAQIPAPSDLREGPDVELSVEILDQARALHQNPIEIFEFVQNHVEMEFYHGSLKGALESLRQKTGNDVDQASLLIALMRASGTPARYVRGVIALSEAQALAWTGLTSSRRVAELLTASGIPYQAIRQGGTIRSFELEHTWAEVYVTYNNYRGAPLDAVGQAWIPLDPSFKSVASTRGIDIRAAMNFKADVLVGEYLSGPQALSPVGFYKKKITDYLTASRPDLKFEQLLGRRTLQPAAIGLLPSTLPYPTISVNQEAAALPEPLRHRVRLVAGGEGAPSFDVTLPTSELMNRRLTLSYVPATVEDQIAVNAFLGLDNTPAYLVKLRPVLKLGGVIVKAGETPIQMGTTHTFTIEIQTPRGTFPISNELMAGGYYAIGLGSRHSMFRAPERRPPEDTEGLPADLLYQLAAHYLERWNEDEQEIAQILDVVNVGPALSEVMIGLIFNVTSLFGQPQSMEWRGVFVDADLRLSDPIPIAADDELRREFLRLSGLAGSMLEGEVLQRDLEVDAVSGARLIQLAKAGGIPVENIDASNAATLLPLLQTADIVKTEIRDAVNQGWRAIVPRSDFTRNIWNGIGYILLDDASGAAGYFISGSLAGAVTPDPPHQWVLQQYARILGHSNSPGSNPDPLAAVSIRKVTITDKKDGTSGKEVDTPLAVWVRDAAGKPVEGAVVTFTILAGGGTFASGRNEPNLTATTDYLGVAIAKPLLGEHTSDAPSFVKVRQTDTYSTQVGVNTVTASVRGIAGDVFLDAPFQVFAHPDEPRHIRKIVGDENVGTAGATGGSIHVRVVDRYNNPISNVNVHFTVLQATPEVGGPLPPTARNLVVYSQVPRCANQTPLLGDCDGRPQVPVVSSIFGAIVETILGDTIATKFQVSVALPGYNQVPAAVFSLHSLGSRSYGTNQYRLPTLHMTSLQLINDAKGIVNATKIGTRFQRPIEIVLYVVEDNYLIVPVDGPCDPATQACWKVKSLETSRTRAIDIHRPGPRIPFSGQSPDQITAPKENETARVTFTVTQGGGTTDPPVASRPDQSKGQGRYETFLTVGPQPASNKVDVEATAEVWVPHFDLQAGTVKLPSNPEPMSVGYSLPHEVFGVRVTALSKIVYVSKTEDPSVPYVTAADFTLQYQIEPASYHGVSLELDLFETPSFLPDKYVRTLLGTPAFGSGTAKLLFGTALDAGEHHVVEAVLNRGSQAEVRSDRADLILKPVVVEIQNGGVFSSRDSTDYMAPGYSRTQGSPVDADTDPAKIFYKIDAPGVDIASAVLKINAGSVRSILLPAASGESETTWDGKDTAGKFVAPGVPYGLTLEATTTDGSIVFRSAPHLIHVVDVTYVEFLNPANDSSLQANSHPDKPGGSMIFADRPTLAEAVTDKVKVNVRLSARVPSGDLKVFFKSFDVKDPTGLLNDNKPISGVFGIGDVPAEGKLSDTDVETDGDDWVHVEFTVTRQPGDNFKIAASTNSRLIAALTKTIIDSNIDDKGDTTLPLLQSLTSERLTVWRRLHVEVDSMGLVTGNTITGTIIGAPTPSVPGYSVVKTNQVLQPARAKRFEPTVLPSGNKQSAARLYDSAANVFEVWAVAARLAGLEVEVMNNGTTVPAVGAFTLVDDDDFDDGDGANPDGDEGEDVPAPDTSLLQDSTSGASNAFAYAYVVPKYDLTGNDSAVPFVLNTPWRDEREALLLTYKFDNEASESDDTFWTVYLLGAYQGRTDEDGDPADEDTLYGVTDSSQGLGSSVFAETNRAVEFSDRWITPAEANKTTVVHEIGHLFKGDHPDGGLMGDFQQPASSRAAALKFDDKTLLLIRGINHP